MDFLLNPLAGVILALVLGAIGSSGRTSTVISRILFAVAWLAGFVPIAQESLLAALVFTLAIGGLALWARPEIVPRYFGKITPRRRLLFSRAVQPIIEIGDSGTKIAWNGPQGESMMTLVDRSELTIETIKGRVMVSTEIFDTDGKLVAEIERNEWRAPPPRAWDRNYSVDAFEVKNDEGQIVLQAKALHDRIQIQGEWWNEAGQGVRLVSRGPGAGAEIVMFRVKETPPQPPFIRPMFRYPSETHLGELAP
ncbi:hypothetical protein [Microbaculum marinum]|uniref:Uncharacterized protein n=1 Tax=Microbaculum marinum TaxID=1764581 RepID=A0AAW9RUS4_9HYPH